jgi:hypothetical protein
VEANGERQKPGAMHDSVAGDPLRALDMNFADDQEKKKNRAHFLFDSRFRRPCNMRDLQHAADMTGQEELLKQCVGLRTMCKWFLRQPWFEPVMASIVFIDITAMALAVDFHAKAPAFFDGMDLTTLFIFVMELVIRIFARPTSIFCKDRMLLLDATLVALSIIQVVLQDGLQFDLSSVMAIRVVRVLRILRIGKVFNAMYTLRTLLEAIFSSLYPLLVVLMLTTITLVAFSTVMTSLLPQVVDEDEETKAALLHFFPSVGTSALTLLEGMSGASNWGPDIAFHLFRGASEGKPGPTAMLVVMCLCFFSLRLGLNGLVTAIFLEQLFAVSDREDEQLAHADLKDKHTAMEYLISKLGEQMADNDERITWTMLEKVLSESKELQEQLHLSVEEAENLFNHLPSNSGTVTPSVDCDTFVFAVFRLQAVSHSVDMLAIDYQQEKGLSRIVELDSNLRFAVAGIHHQLQGILASIAGLESLIASTHKDVAEVQELEAALERKHNLRVALQNTTGEKQRVILETESSAAGATVADLRGKFDLHRHLSELEALGAALTQQRSSTSDETERHVGLVADAIVQSMQTVLVQELSKVSKASAERERGWQSGRVIETL